MAYRHNPDLPWNSNEISSMTQYAYKCNTVNLEGLVWFSTQKAKTWQTFMYLANNTLLFHGKESVICEIMSEWHNNFRKKPYEQKRQICAILYNLDCTSI